MHFAVNEHLATLKNINVYVIQNVYPA